jgi:hypothetical protein
MGEDTDQKNKRQPVTLGTKLKILAAVDAGK